MFGLKLDGYWTHKFGIYTFVSYPSGPNFEPPLKTCKIKFCPDITCRNRCKILILTFFPNANVTCIKKGVCLHTVNTRCQRCRTGSYCLGDGEMYGCTSCDQSPANMSCGVNGTDHSYGGYDSCVSCPDGWVSHRILSGILIS